MKEALNVARSPSRMDEASVLLKDHVYAASSRETIRRKRIKIEELARCFIEAGSSPYPLQEATIWQVSAALKAAKFRSAHTYLYELRLGHIEAKYNVPLWMDRVFSHCKRALLRGIGPPNRAETV
eukprot:6466767-Amphidinium_carterae.1